MRISGLAFKHCDSGRELFNHGFNALLIDGKRIVINKPNYNLESDLEPSKVIDVLRKLILLVAGL